MAVLEPYRTSWAWLALERGMKVGKIPVVTTTVAILAARVYDERERESLEATGGRWGQIEAMLRGIG